MSDTPTIGASELAVTCGLQRRRPNGTPWTSGLELWARLRGILPRYDDDSGPDAEAGQTMEPGIGNAYAKRHGLAWGTDIGPGPQIPAPGYACPELTWLRVRPDFLVPARRRVVQAKAPREIVDDEWGPSGSDEVPVWVVVQEVAELAVMSRLFDWQHADVEVHARAARWGQRSRASYTLTRDTALEARLLIIGGAWYQRHVIDGVPPAPDGSPSASRALSRMFRPRDAELTAEPDDLERWARLVRDKRAVADLEARIAAEEQLLKVRMGEHTKLTAPNGDTLATWRAKRGAERLDVVRLRREEPELAARYTVVGEPGRTFHTETPEEDPTA